MALYQVILLRHGESIWNRENRFSGWTDVDLSRQGVNEARQAGRLLKDGGFTFDIAFTSVLKRAIRTLWIVLDEMNLMYIPISHSWRLNERHYGALQGLDKQGISKRYGEEQVRLWRRSYLERPPALSADDPRHPKFDPRYRGIPEAELPVTESLEDTLNRVLPFWHSAIASALREERRVLVAAHGNSLRALVKYLDRIPNTAIADVNIPTGFPRVYELNGNLRPVRNYYLGDPEEIQRATEKAGSLLKEKDET
jgi:2,3-bisphosphoglycerate-dependent phosphoglycerate mutase